MRKALLAILSCIAFVTASAEPQGTAFTYQGQLKQLSEPANGFFDFQFELYDAPGGGASLAPPIRLEDVMVSEGIFTVELDFGLAPFAGEQLWLEIFVREGLSEDPFSILEPRQALTATPYALHALSVAPGSVTLLNVAPECSQGDVLVMGVSNWSCCTPPLEEVCDSLDNDCDGSVDETFDDLGMDCGDGQCAGGTVVCAPGGDSTLCSTGPGGPDDLSTDEVCDDIDNNCNGLVDETFPIGMSCGEGQCAGGETICDPSGESTLCSTMPGGPFDQSTDEVCDGIDNNCDGDIDEIFLIGLPCGEGQCSGGEIVCALSGDSSLCSTEPGGPNDQSEPEICDGVDNDCDGVVDDDLPPRACYSGPPPTEGVGLCTAGLQSCAQGGWGSCIGEVLPVPETCDNQDNDCDDLVDELLERACYTGIPSSTEGVGVCVAGTQSCTAGMWGTCAGEVTPIPEICGDELDNNCNGIVDDGC
jgi:hypothetical protein